MDVTFLGTGTAMPLPGRAQSGLLLEADGVEAGDSDANGGADDRAERRLLVDCGSGVLARLAETDVSYEGVSTVLLTHHHLDHVSDLMALLKARWLAGEEFLTVVGPPGTEALVSGLLSVHDYLDGRVDLTVREETGEFSAAGFDVRSLETRHSMCCQAYRFGDALTVSGDTEAFEALADFADGSRAFVHECSFPDDVDVSNHPTPSQLGAVLAGHEYGRVYLTHLYPHTAGRHEEMLASIRERFDGDVRFAHDGLRITV